MTECRRLSVQYLGKHPGKTQAPASLSSLSPRSLPHCYPATPTMNPLCFLSFSLPLFLSLTQSHWSSRVHFPFSLFSPTAFLLSSLSPLAPYPFLHFSPLSLAHWSLFTSMCLFPQSLSLPLSLYFSLSVCLCLFLFFYFEVFSL